MLICGYEKFSMVDYDEKIACTVFTGGCNFRCPFCHNSALIEGNVQAQAIDHAEIFEYLGKRKGLVDAVCVTGGEPTLQPDLCDFLSRIRDMGYLTKLDTNGYRPDVLERVLANGLVDYVAMDIKNSLEKYALATGLEKVDGKRITDSIELLKNSGVDYEFRTTLIKEFHTDEDMKSVADLINGAPRYFLQKYNDNEGCLLHGYTAVDKNDALRLSLYFDGKVAKTGLRGYN